MEKYKALVYYKGNKFIGSISVVLPKQRFWFEIYFEWNEESVSFISLFFRFFVSLSISLSKTMTEVTSIFSILFASICIMFSFQLNFKFCCMQLISFNIFIQMDQKKLTFFFFLFFFPSFHHSQLIVSNNMEPKLICKGTTKEELGEILLYI